MSQNETLVAGAVVSVDNGPVDHVAIIVPAMGTSTLSQDAGTIGIVVDDLHPLGVLAIWRYGLQRIINDASTRGGKDSNAESRKAFADKKLAALMDGTVKVASVGVPSTLKAWRRVLATACQWNDSVAKKTIGDESMDDDINKAIKLLIAKIIANTRDMKVPESIELVTDSMIQKARAKYQEEVDALLAPAEVDDDLATLIAAELGD